MALLELHDVQTIFRTEAGVLRAVDGVSYSVDSGRTLGVVGESGCGKSVTALSIMRLVPNPPGEIVAGRVLLEGRDILALPAKEMTQVRGKEISMIFQDPMTSLNPVFTIAKQLGEVLALRFGMKGEPARKRMIEALEMVGISEPAARLAAYPHELSGGMKQRIMIAMALLTEPKVLIADEPTTALDVTIQAQILFLMKDLQKRMGTAVILITHSMGVIAETCDDVAVMYAGRVVERTDVRRVFSFNRHPYTRGLLRSIPTKGLSKETPLPTIDGTVPSLITPPKGCRFAERCERRQDRCTAEDPLLREVAPGHFAACHFPYEQPA
jgi:oligopeptide/dipeptide ABC transporter ATP-binding protein